MKARESSPGYRRIWTLVFAGIPLLGLPLLGLLALPEVEAEPNPVLELSAAALTEDSQGAVEERLTEAPRHLNYLFYRVQAGDTISGIAQSYGVKQDTLISFNGITRTRALQIGTLLKIPNMDGLLHTLKATDNLESLAQTYEVDPQDILQVNRLDPEVVFQAGASVFIPGAAMNSTTLREINGDLFRYPVRGGRFTSGYGFRRDPFTGQRSFHNAIDLAAPIGTPVVAPMEGRVVSTGYSSASGNYIVIAHHSGYSTSYAHLNAILVRPGQSVVTGQRIGEVGNTGYSTGPHLHFSVFKNGRSINPIYVLH